MSSDTDWPRWLRWGSGPEHGADASRDWIRVASAAPWLFYLVEPVSDLFHRPHSAVEIAAGAAALVAFAALYLWGVALGFAHVPDPSYPRGLVPLAALAALTLVLIAVYGASWLGLLVYVTAVSALIFEPTRIVPATAAIMAIGAAAALGLGASAADATSLAFQIFLVGLLMLFIRRMLALIRELREAREDVARLAVVAERLRFARDLHDLLGHSLSLIVLKSALAGKLLDRDPVAAAAELADIESVGRRSLVEVRQAVTGYRQASLAAELDHARTALEAAGIDATVRVTGTPLPSEAEALLGWAVREGVTNVLRHSHARRCEIAIRRDDASAELEVRDDGVGALGAAVVSATGSGLRGLAERMATAGGDLEASAQPGGGFRLAVRLPVGSPA